PEPEPEPEPEPAPVKNYADVPETHWAAEAISYVTEAGLFKGTSATEFSPNGNMTRAMLMVVLARLDGVDTEGGDGKWYEKGMEWAVEQGITDGSSPNANITRQQLVTMLWRYAGKPASNASLDGYSDASEVASWATEAMKWAVENGIIKGTKKDVLSPNGYATRAQVATIIMRFVDM
ncbi:MAG: S-layer homology domain-containing protein, partial [Oscillospiraceae bacterium]|nr:S-layer homology domain-containing protein [Oscillospiraceae bacterium]